MEKLMMLMDEVSLKGPTEISVVAGKEGSTIKLDLIHHPSYIKGGALLPCRIYCHDVLGCC